MIYGPRHRSASWQKLTNATYKRYSDENGSIIADYSATDIPYESETRVMDDVVTENFRNRVKAGEIIMSPMHSIVQNVFRTPSSDWIHFPSDNSHPSHHYYDMGEWYRDGLCPDVVTNEDISTDIEVCLTKAFAKVDSSVAALPVTFGELRETKEMLVTALLSLKNIHKFLKVYRDKLRSALDAREKTTFVLDQVLNSWMAVRFGWLPFAGDVNNLYSAMTKLQKYEERQTFRSGATLTFQAAGNYIYSAGGETYTFSRTAYRTVNISAGVLCKQRYGGVPDTYGLCKFPGIIWELTRLSWAIDYFFNVADVIASFTPDSLWSPAASWTTVRTRTTQEIMLTSYTPPPGFTGGINGGTRRTRTYEVDRVPNPTRAGINFRPRMNWARYIDLAGVLRSPLKKTLKQVMKLDRKLKRRLGNA